MNRSPRPSRAHPRLRLAPIAACLPLLGLHVQPTRAQDAATLPEVRVLTAPAARTPASTASRLDLTPMQTPASVDVITRDQLEARGDASLVDAITRATGLTSLAHPGNSGSSLSSRGFTDTTSVMRLYDGTRQYGGVGLSFPFDTWAVERIEVLRGPASVIHGDGAIGAVVNVIPKKPSRDAVRSEVQATVGTEGKRGLAFGSGGAIDERWSYRVDASGDRSNGWVDRGDSRRLAFSGALQLDVSPELSMKLSHAYGKQNPMRYFGMPLVDGRPLDALREKNYDVGDSKIEYRDRWSEFAVQWSPRPDVQVRSKLYRIESDRYWRNVENYTYNAGTGLIDRDGATEIAHDQTQTGTTTDVAFDGTLLGRTNRVSIGFDVNRSRFQHTNNTYTGTVASVDPYDPVPGSYASPNPFLPRYRNEADQYAVFAEDRLELNKRWSVVAGLRHDRVDVKRVDLIGAQNFERRYANTGWRLGTVFQPSADVSLYAQFSKAADPASGLLMLSPANNAAASRMSTGRQVEVGVKQTFWDGTGDWTLAVYDIQKKNLLARDPDNAALRVQVGERSSRGVEGTVSLPLTRTLRLDANAAVLRARFDDFSEGPGRSRDGNVPPDVPERVANAWLAWNVVPGWTASGGLRHVGKRYADNANTLVMPAYTTTDLALQWQASADTTLSLRGFNVFDKRYFSTAYYNTTQWFVGEGRRVELSLNQRF